MRCSHRLAVLVLVTAFGFLGRASAVEWLIVGARQRGMGGAGVATADEVSAIYWNPASLSGDVKWSAGIDANFSIELAPNTLDQLSNLVDTIETLQADFTGLQTSFDSLSTPDTATNQDLAKVLDLVLNHFSHLDRKDLGLLLDAGANVGVQAGSFGVGVNFGMFFDAGLVADVQGLAMAALGDATSNMDSAMYVDGTVDYTTVGSVTYPAEIDALGNTIETMLTDAGVADANQKTAVLLYVASYTSDPADPDYDPNSTNPLEGDLALSVLGITDFANADLSDPDVQSMLTNIVGATLGDRSLIETNETGIHVRGALVGEVAIAKSFPIVKDRLKVGGAVKVMSARTFNFDITYADYSRAAAVNDVLDDLAQKWDTQVTGDPLTSTQLGLDLGVDFQLNKFVRLGMTMKNLNRPEFDLPDTSEKFVIEPQVRVGVAVRPLTWLCVTSDMDLTENRSQIATDYGMRHFSLGTELSVLKFFQFRLGLYGNLLAPDSKPAFTGGFGVKVGPVFKLDLAVNANLGGDMGSISGLMGGGDLQVSDIPEGLGLSLTMQFHTKF